MTWVRNMVSNGGYVAQVKEMELMRRDNARMVGELKQKDAQLDHVRHQLATLQGELFALGALAKHQVRVSFSLGLGAAVVAMVVGVGIAKLF